MILGRDFETTLQAAENAVEAVSHFKGVILPFPGGVVRSGSKIGSKYRFLSASTNSAYCPTIKGLVDSKLSKEINCVLEIVIVSTSELELIAAMKSSIISACIPGILEITAGNYGGALGQHRFYLHDILK